MGSKKISWKHLLVLLAVVFLIGLNLIIAWQAKNLVGFIKSGAIAKAQEAAGDFSQTSGFLDKISLGKIDSLSAAHHCSNLLAQTRRFELLDQNTHTLLEIDLTPFTNFLEQNDQIISECLNSAKNSRLIKAITPGEYKNVISQLPELHEDSKLLLGKLTGGEQVWLILFQNSDEIRATGGFTGSYALATINNGKISELVFEDIYDADGQFDGYVSPPPGVLEYLSSDRGMRLPDANWNPDAPESIQQQLVFFALGRKQNIDGVVVVNLPFAEKVLKTTGPVYLPDYDVYVSSQNLHQALRDERNEFFAGNIQKKHLLSQAVKQVLFKLKNLDIQQAKQLASTAQIAIKQKEIMVYSREEKLQNLFEKYQATGQLKTQAGQYFVGLVESNVGINKANRNVQRDVVMALRETSSSITINFHNNNLPNLEPPKTGAPTNGYVNYQRLLINPDWQVISISINNQPIPTWDESEITSSDGQILKQIGYLITVPEQTSAQTKIEINYPPLVLPGELSLYKQPGLASTPYIIQTPSGNQHVLLESDQVVVLE